MRVLCFAIALLAAVPARAEVTRVEVTSRADLAFAGYERITGRVFFAVDPADPRNAVIADIDKAPRNAQGKVEFSSDFHILRPKSGGNGVALLDVVNRGGLRALPLFNRARGGDEIGDGFLMQRGFTAVAVGWEFDLAGSGNQLRIQVPAA